MGLTIISSLNGARFYYICEGARKYKHGILTILFIIQ